MDWISLLWVEFTSLTWYQMILWVVYTLYFIRRSYVVYYYTNIFGIKKGYKDVFIDGDNAFRIYHVIRTILDIPPMILGLFFPALRKILSFKIYEFKKKEENENKHG